VTHARHSSSSSLAPNHRTNVSSSQASAMAAAHPRAGPSPSPPPLHLPHLHRRRPPFRADRCTAPTPTALATAKTQGRGGQDQARRTCDLRPALRLPVLVLGDGPGMEAHRIPRAHPVLALRPRPPRPALGWRRSCRERWLWGRRGGWCRSDEQRGGTRRAAIGGNGG
jgi:hypothetical protein